MNRVQPDTALPKQKAILTYTALLTQTGTNAPTAEVLQNDLEGEVVWTRLSQGRYIGTLPDDYPVNKTAIKIEDILPGLWNYCINTEDTGDNNEVYIQSVDYQGAYFDDNLLNTLIEIKIYTT